MTLKMISTPSIFEPPKFGPLKISSHKNQWSINQHPKIIMPKIFVTPTFFKYLNSSQKYIGKSSQKTIFSKYF
jgi:hypothetical protein